MRSTGDASAAGVVNVFGSGVQVVTVRFFQRIAANADVRILAHAIQRKPYLWNADPVRTTFPNSPHAEVDDILLRFEEMDPETVAEASYGDADARAALEAAPRKWREGWSELPEAKPLVMSLMLRVGAYELARVMITRLKPGGMILPHADTEGEYANLPDIARYHMVVQGLPGFRSTTAAPSRPCRC